MSIGGGSIVGTALVLVVPKTDGVEAKIQSDVKGALAKIDGRLPITADTKAAEQNVANLGRSIEQQAAASIAASAKEREETQLLAAEYQKAAAAAVAGSEEQVAAATLAADAYKKVAASSIVGSEEQIAASKAAAEAQTLLRVETEKSGGAMALVKSKLDGIAGSGNLVTKSLNEVQGAGVDMSQTLSTAFVGVGVGIAAVGAVLTEQGIKKFQDGTAEVRKLKGVLGSTAEEASQLRNIAQGLGVNTDSLTKGLQKLSVGLETTGGDFHGVRVEIAHNQDGSADLVKTLDNVRATYQSLSDPLEKNRLLQDAFSKGGLQLRAVLSLTNAEFDKLKSHGPVYSQKDLDDSIALARAQAALGQAFQKLEVDLARGVVPTLTAVEHGFTAIVNAADRLHISVPTVIEIGVAGLAAAKGVALLGAGYEAAVAGAGRLAGAFGIEAAAARASAVATEAAAVADAQLTVAETAAGTAAAGAATKTGLFASAAAGFSALPLVGQAALLTGGLLLAARAADDHVGALKRLDAGFIDAERHIPLVGGFLAGLDAKVTGATSSTKSLGKAGQDTAGSTDLLAGAAEKADKNVGMIAGSVAVLTTALNPAAHELAVAGGATKDLAAEFDKAQSAADTLSTKLDKLLGGAVSVDTATSNYQQSLADLTKTLGENGTSLDLTTEKGRANQKVIDAVVTSTHDHIQALIDNGATMDQVRGAFNGHIEDFRRVLRQMGLNEDQIQSLIDKYGLIPGSVETAVQLVGAEKAKNDADSLVAHLVEEFGIAQNAAKISVQVFGADNAESTLSKLKSDTGDIVGPIKRAEQSAPPADGGGGSDPAFDTSPGRAREHEGGILPYYAQGGREIHQAFVARAGTPTRVFNEPETGGEGYIPLAQSKRPRSEAILSDIAHTFGGAYVRGGAQHFDMGLWPGPSTSTTSTVNTAAVGPFALHFHIAGGLTTESIGSIGDVVEAAVRSAVSSGVLGQAMESHRMGYR